MPPKGQREDKEKKKQWFNRGTKLLNGLVPGDTVRVLDNNGLWSIRAKVLKQCNTPRSYEVVTDNGRHLRRNRCALRRDRTAPESDQVDPGLLEDILAMKQAMTEVATEGEMATTCVSTPQARPTAGMTLRRSKRTIRPPERLNL